MWKNIFGVNDLNPKMMPMLLSPPLYIIWARMYLKLHCIYHTDGKSVHTVLVIMMSRGCMCKHSGISLGKVCVECWWLQWVEDVCVNILEYHQECYLVLCYFNKIIHKTSEMTYIQSSYYYGYVISHSVCVWQMEEGGMGR
jgi:hypothetical protein